MIESIPFGKTGHVSKRTIFGAAALGSVKQSKADQILEILLEFGVNHIDTAAGYGDSELRIGKWMTEHRQHFFLASKTGDRTKLSARNSIERSLERLKTDHIDLMQMHNLVNQDDWDIAMGPDGALEALIDAKAQGLIKHIGVTGHGSYAAKQHMRSLEHYQFASVLLPYNDSMMQQSEYRSDFERLYSICAEKQIGLQTIKSIAHRRWKKSDTEPPFSWYKPIRDSNALMNAVHYVLARPTLFLNTSSDANLLRPILVAASQPIFAPSPETMKTDQEALGIEPLFVRGVTDEI